MKRKPVTIRSNSVDDKGDHPSANINEPSPSSSDNTITIDVESPSSTSSQNNPLVTNFRPVSRRFVDSEQQAQQLQRLSHHPELSAVQNEQADMTRRETERLNETRGGLDDPDAAPSSEASDNGLVAEHDWIVRSPRGGTGAGGGWGDAGRSDESESERYSGSQYSMMSPQFGPRSESGEWRASPSFEGETASDGETDDAMQQEPSSTQASYRTDDDPGDNNLPSSIESEDDSEEQHEPQLQRQGPQGVPSDVTDPVLVDPEDEQDSDGIIPADRRRKRRKTRHEP